ncbi:MAG: FAD-binding oxidoreductase [Ilumatobacteraceae bacterium]
MERTTGRLTGWGGTAPTVATLVDTDADDLTAPGVLGELAGPRGVIARGLGRSYGDPAQNGGGTVVRLLPSADPIRLDPTTASVTVDASVSLDTLLRVIIPQGWFVPVSPGTRFVTVGGAIASDIHGKGHHVDGSFGRHVTSMEMLLADGQTRTVTEATDPDLWWATIGGMGLTGIILRATFGLIAIETQHCLVDIERVPNLDALLERMESGDHRYRYSVAWVDLVATGRHLGRSVLSRGNHATVDELREFRPRAAHEPLLFDPPSIPDVPPGIPNMVIPLTVRPFNELWYRKAPKRHHGTETLTAFFHPLDMVGRWNRLYGRNGFLQYQFVVPFEAVDTLRTIVTKISDEGHASPLTVLKRMGAASGGLLSFPTPGWTLTVDLAAGDSGLPQLVRDLDELVLAAGGRHYLAKDSHATPEVIRAGYPRLDEWRSIRSRFDPAGMWASDQARRLDLL